MTEVNIIAQILSDRGVLKKFPVEKMAEQQLTQSPYCYDYNHDRDVQEIHNFLNVEDMREALSDWRRQRASTRWVCF